MTEPDGTKRARGGDETIKETLISIVISFAMAFVFRSYVVEPFRIPTGSMAPTLLGAHVRFWSPVSGYSWSVNPRDPGGGEPPSAIQGQTARGYDPLQVADPMTRAPLQQANAPLRAGDRILVLKYLYLVREPQRYEVVVFKNPEDTRVNLIKRLVGLPNEQLWLVDGDVFARPVDDEGEPEGGWAIQRKPERVQREVWAPLFSSEFAPEPADAPAWTPPWTGDGWDLAGRQYRWDSADAGRLEWDQRVRAINDYVPYNQTLPDGHPATAYAYPVSDLRVRAGFNPDAPGLVARLRIEAHGRTFEARVGDGAAEIVEAGVEPETLASGDGVTLEPGRFTDVEFWHADQSLSLWVDGDPVAEATYDWTPDERLRAAAGPGVDDPANMNVLDPRNYRTPSVGIEVAGAPVTLARVELDRDLYYRPVRGRSGFGRATHRDTVPTLGPDQFFMLGDNSAASHDARSWSRVDPWVGALAGWDEGVVDRRMLLGKAFFVYWPAPYFPQVPPGLRVPVPDTGRLRFIR